MKTLVTGGAGFIGSHMTDLILEKGHEVVIIDNFATGRQQNLERHKNNKNLTIVKTDITDSDSLAPHFKDINMVFHLAALADIVPSIERPIEYHRTNVDGTVNVLQAALKHHVKRFVYVASSSCYGIPDNYPTRETDEIRPQYPYALTKFIGEQYVLHWAKVYKLPAVSLRLFNVFGPRSRTSGVYGAVFGVFLKQKLAGKPFTVVGDGTQTRDFTYVTDIANALWKAANSSIVGEIFNVGSGGTYSINLLTDLLQGEKIYIPKRPGEPDCTFADTTKIRKVLDWKPLLSFEEGVKHVLANIDYWKDAPLWDEDTIADATRTWFKYLSSEGV